jgi:predicted acetyltransferase
MTALAEPSLDLYETWAAAVAEFGGAHVDGSSIRDDEAHDTSREACERLVSKAARDRDRGVAPGPGRVHQTLSWIVEADQVVGFVSLRHDLTDFLAHVGGHIGYSVRPSARRRGHATRALGLALDQARALDLERVLLTCDDDNVASARTIESQGGVLEAVVDGRAYGYGDVRRYWIAL